MAHYIGYELIEALVERPFDHERDLRNLRGFCSVSICNERPCNREGCDRGCDAHGTNPVDLPNGTSRIVCDGCVQEQACENCDRPFVRWQLRDGFCGGCASVCRTVEAGESW